MDDEGLYFFGWFFCYFFFGILGDFEQENLLQVSPNPACGQ